MNTGISFLSADQLADMTGYVQPAAQIRWLERNEIWHFVRADGKVRVPVPITKKPAAASSPVPGPNLDAVRVRH